MPRSAALEIWADYRVVWLTMGNDAESRLAQIAADGVLQPRRSTQGRERLLSDEAARALRAGLGPRVRFGEPLARHTSLRIGGPADVFVRAESVDDLRTVLGIVGRDGHPVFMLGGGTNLLVSDRGVRGVVLKLGRGFDYVHWEGDGDLAGAVATVGAGARVGRVVRWSVENGLAGLEFAEGIPGTVGGGLLMNAGAYGGEIGAMVDAVSGLTADGDVTRIGRDGLQFRYRHVVLPKGFVVTEVTLRLRREPVGALRARMREVRRRRENSQPRGFPTAGSMFKNPAADHAGRLIEAAGLKGARIGAAQISERHGNFFVNLGGARAADMRALMDLAQRVVWERFRVRLEPEVRLVGEW